MSSVDRGGNMRSGEATEQPPDDIPMTAPVQIGVPLFTTIIYNAPLFNANNGGAATTPPIRFSTHNDS
jgi:hypothetical protein